MEDLFIYELPDSVRNLEGMRRYDILRMALAYALEGKGKGHGDQQYSRSLAIATVKRNHVLKFIVKNLTFSSCTSGLPSYSSPELDHSLMEEIFTAPVDNRSCKVLKSSRALGLSSCHEHNQTTIPRSKIATSPSWNSAIQHQSV